MASATPELPEFQTGTVVEPASSADAASSPLSPTIHVPEHQKLSDQGAELPADATQLRPQGVSSSNEAGVTPPTMITELKPYSASENGVDPSSIRRPSTQSAQAAKENRDPQANLLFPQVDKIKDPRPNQSGLFNFANTEAIKERVRTAKLRPDPYDVHDFYWSTGLFQKIAKNHIFENTTLGIIMFNALWISFDTDGNTAETINDADVLYIVMDVLFFGYFFFDVFVRFMAFQSKFNCRKDGWFVFDSSLVFLYFCDPFLIGIVAKASGGGGLPIDGSILRLFRLARLSRLVRMLRSLPELMIMIKGMVSAMASVVYTLGLLFLITYVFAITLRNLVNSGILQYPAEDGTPPIEEEYFSSVPEAMHNLLIFGTFLDALSDFMLAVKQQNTPCFILCWVYIILASLTVMNMLIGVLCEVISAVAEEEKESMMVDKVHEKFKHIVVELDESGDGCLSWKEFQKILDNPAAVRALESVNVDPCTMVDMAEDFFYEDGVEVNVKFDEFMEMVLDLRGGQQATVENVMKLAKRFNSKFYNLATRMDSFDERLESIDGKIGKLLARKRERSAPAR